MNSGMNISQDNALLIGKMIMLSSKAYQNLPETHFQERYFYFKNPEMRMAYKMHIRKNSIGSNAKGNKPQHSRRSHIRKAHWHYYNAGSGDSKRLELRWVREISVNDNTDAHSVRIVLVRQNR